MVHHRFPKVVYPVVHRIHWISSVKVLLLIVAIAFIAIHPWPFECVCYWSSCVFCFLADAVKRGEQFHDSVWKSNLLIMKSFFLSYPAEEESVFSLEINNTSSTNWKEERREQSPWQFVSKIKSLLIIKKSSLLYFLTINLSDHLHTHGMKDIFDVECIYMSIVNEKSSKRSIDEHVIIWWTCAQLRNGW